MKKRDNITYYTGVTKKEREKLYREARKDGVTLSNEELDLMFLKETMGVITNEIFSEMAKSKTKNK